MNRKRLSIIQIPRRFVTSDWGGTETVVLETSRILAAEGHDNRIWTSMALCDKKEEQIQGVSVRRFGYLYPYLRLSESAARSLDYKGGNLFSFSLLHALFRHPKLDIIHLHTGKRMGGIGRLVAKWRKIPYVISLHGGHFDVPDSQARALADPTTGLLEWGKVLGWLVGSRQVIDEAAAIICLGANEEAALRKQWPDKKVVRLENGVDVATFELGDGPRFKKKFNVPSGAFTVLCVGRIDPQKDQLSAIKSFELFRDRFADTHLVIVGHVTDQLYFHDVADAIARSPHKDAITLIPGVSRDTTDLIDAYTAASCFLLTSRHEPFGIVILEAWAARLPVVASEVGGIPSFVEHGTDGLLAPAGDATAFAQHLADIHEDVARATCLAEAGHAKASSRYSWNSITRRLEDLYYEVIADYQKQ
jgi:glycosyltransferase involved in cell wall biosynthesis